MKKSSAASKPENPSHPWDKVFGSMADNDGFDEAVRLGKEYPDSQRPKDAEEEATTNS
ncbi:MAG: hypothetical protein ABJA67_09110 [Chthonomonadales bacterium]